MSIKYLQEYEEIEALEEIVQDINKIKNRIDNLIFSVEDIKDHIYTKTKQNHSA